MMSARLHSQLVLAGLVFGAVVVAILSVFALRPRSAPAQQVGCGAKITTDTRLEGDLVNCPNNGIVIGADGITLNLNGHVIDGDGAPTANCPDRTPCDIGVVNDGHDRVVIKGGAIREFDPGVFVYRARHALLRDLSTVENTGNGIVLSRSARSRVQGNSASRNGLTTDFPGIVLFESHNNRITHNTMAGNGDLGLILYGSDRNHISYNSLRRNPEDGMIIHGSDNEIFGNRMIRNGGGVLISKVGNFGPIVGNEVRRNYVRDPRAGGIAVDPVSKRTVVSRNLVVGAGRGGIMVGNRTTKLTGNRAFRNADLGIRAVEGVIDGGGNRASGNGDPRQCVNVTCQ
jgi:parallel beta-helix repeat protein